MEFFEKYLHLTNVSVLLLFIVVCIHLVLKLSRKIINTLFSKPDNLKGLKIIAVNVPIDIW